MSGPDYIHPTDNLYTWDANEYTKIQKTAVHPSNMEPRSVITVVKEKCEEGGDSQTAFKVFRELPKEISPKEGHKGWASWSWKEYYEDIQIVTRAFIKLGLEERHTVCVQGFNSPEWVLSCQAAIHAGGIVSGTYFNYS